MLNVEALIVISGWIGLILLSAVLCKKYFPEKNELARKIVHIGAGPVIPLAWWFNISKELAIGFACFITINLLINYQFQLISAIENVERKSIGTVNYGLSITLLIILYWPKNAAAVTAGCLVMAFGDGLAGLIGKKFKSQKWQIFGQTKSIAGTFTMGIVSCLVLISINLIIELPIMPLKLLVMTCFAVVLEQISYRGLDNLTVPMGVAWGWSWMTSI